MSKKKSKGKRDLKAYEDAKERDEMICQYPKIDGMTWPDNPGPICGRSATEIHHRRLRSQGGKDTVDNLVCLCLKCHRWAHDHPKEACEKGIIQSPKFNGKLEE